MDKHKKGIVLTIVSVAVLLISSLMMFIDSGSAQSSPNTWGATWTAEFDNDYRNVYIDMETSAVERYACANPYHVGCLQGSSDMANNDVFSSPPTVVKWTNAGSVNQGGSQFSYTEDWIAGDGLGSEVDYNFKQRGYSGTTSNRDHSWGFFTGEARLKSEGSGMRLEYRMIFASAEGGSKFDPDCNSKNYSATACSYWLAWGDLPASSLSDPVTSTSYSNDDFEAHLRRLFGEMDPGMPTKWTVTGRII